MEKKFTILRFVGAVWKIMAWIVLGGGLLGSLGILLTSIFGGGIMGGMMSQYGQQGGWMTGLGILGGVAVFIVSLIVTVIYFLLLYAVGELIFLLLAIEENTRMTARWIQMRPTPAPYPTPPPAYTPPPPPPPPSPPAPQPPPFPAAES
jgi:hypothetical protein